MCRPAELGDDLREHVTDDVAHQVERPRGVPGRDGAVPSDGLPDPAPPRPDRRRTEEETEVVVHPFQAEQPNETWQADFTHHRLTDGTDVEILTWLDDHSRYALSITARRRVTGPAVVATFRQAIARPKAGPGEHDIDTEFRVRHDRVNNGRVSLRIAGQMHHIGLGRTLDGTRVILLIEPPTCMWGACRVGLRLVASGRSLVGLAREPLAAFGLALPGFAFRPVAGCGLAQQRSGAPWGSGSRHADRGFPSSNTDRRQHHDHRS